MDWDLSRDELRVLGSLIEKSLATPDHYPLTVNALTSACNQRSNRDPVMDLSEAAVRKALDGLLGRYLIRENSPTGSRTLKFSHRLGDELGLRFKFDRADLALIGMLILRGPQTAGELRARSGRLFTFSGVEDVERRLERLMERDEPTVARLAREPGRREARYAHLLGDDAASISPEIDPPGAEDGVSIAEGLTKADFQFELGKRVAELEEIVSLLQTEVDELKGKNEDYE